MDNVEEIKEAIKDLNPEELEEVFDVFDIYIFFEGCAGSKPREIEAMIDGSIYLTM